MQKSVLPIFRRRIIRRDRKNYLIRHFFRDRVTKAPTDLSNYVFAGIVAGAKGGAEIVSVSFENDLANGIIFAFLSDADSNTLNDYTDTNGLDGVVWDIKGTPQGGEDEQWFEGVGVPDGVVTP